MEGLEIAEVHRTQLEYSGRLDTEYYRPEYLKYETLLKERGSKPLSHVANFLIGPFGSAFTVENYTQDKTYRYIRGKDVKPMRLMDDDSVYMPQKDFERLSRYSLRPNDLLVSVVGTLGNAAIIEAKDTPAIFSCKSAVVRVNSINPYYLLTYLNSKFGHSLLLRKQRGAVQQGLNLDDLKTLDVFVASTELQIVIEKIYKKSTKITSDSTLAFAQAETLLLQTLGMTNFAPSSESVNIKSFKDSFASSGRLDAEHYQFKYDQLLETFDATGFEIVNIDAIVFEMLNGAEVREYQDVGVPYLRIGDLKYLDIDPDSVVCIDPQSAEKGLNKIELLTGDVLLSRSGSLAVSAVVDSNWTHALISSHLIRLRIRDNRFDPYFFALFLSIAPGKMQIQQWSNGGVQPEINQPALKGIYVPVVSKNTQLQIRKLILKAKELRNESKRLLEVAKRAVEMAIEQDEAAGMDYIEAARV